MDAFLSELSQSVDPVDLGRRLKTARLAAGLTQAQLAGSDVTAAYVSRIEVGQRRPRVHLLERMARRAGTTAHELLTGITTHEARTLELQIEQAALALALGDSATAQREIVAALDRLQDYQDPPLVAAARRVRAEVRRASGDITGALRDLEPLATAANRDVNTLRSIIAMCECLTDRDAPGDAQRAMTLGRQAEVLAIDLRVDVLADMLRLGASRARAHLLAGDLRGARQVCFDTWRRARPHQSPAARASAYRSASSIEASAHGATPAAIELAQLGHALAAVGESTRRLEAILATSTGAARRP